MVDVDTDSRKYLQRWRSIALILLVGAAVRSWLGAGSGPGGVFMAAVWTATAVGMGLAALFEVRRETRRAQR